MAPSPVSTAFNSKSARSSACTIEEYEKGTQKEKGKKGNDSAQGPDLQKILGKILSLS